MKLTVRWVASLCLAVVGAAAGQSDKTPHTLAQLEAAARQDSLDPESHYSLAFRYDSLKRFDDAEREARQAVAIDPHYAPALLLLAYLPYDRRPKLWSEVRRGKVPAAWQSAVEEGDRLAHRAFIIDPLVDFRVMGAPPVEERMLVIPDYGQATTERLLILGLVAFDYARYELAYDALDRYVDRRYARQLDSVSSGILLYRGLAAAHIHAFTRAVADFQVLLDRSLRQEAGDSLIQIPLATNDYRYVLAFLKQGQNRPADAMSLYKEALAADLGLYMAHARLARLYRDVKMWDQAIDESRAAVSANPDDPRLLVDLGETLRDAGRLAEAETTLRQAATANPRDPRTTYTLGAVYLQLGDSGSARAAYNRFLAMAPSRMSAQITTAKQQVAALH
jgi:tetratricopeptide (TPR) repeat protein